MNEDESKSLQEDTTAAINTMVNGFNLLMTFGELLQQKSAEEAEAKAKRIAEHGYRGYESYDDWYQNSLDESPLWDDD